MTEEQKEKKYLQNLLKKVDEHLMEINKAIKHKKTEIDSIYTHLHENKRDMDHLEKNALREVIHNYTLIGDHSAENRKRLFRLRDTAYFGRIDFETGGNNMRIYVGVHHFQDHQSNEPLVYDWRAPVSSLFYDYEPGQAQYTAKSGIIKGAISLKRQFRIRQGKMEYMLDTDLTIHDEVLQKTLNQASGAGMKNIVATIQKEQNSII